MCTASLPLLHYYLALLPRSVRQRQESRFRHVRADLEFVTWVPRHDAGRCAREAIRLGFTVWASVDQASAFLYGAGAGMRAASRRALISWLEQITAPGHRGQVLLIDPSGSCKLIKITVSEPQEFYSQNSERLH